MFRDVLILDDTQRIEPLLEVASDLDWELLHIYPGRRLSDGGYVWKTAQGIDVRCIENRRLNVRYLLFDDAKVAAQCAEQLKDAGARFVSIPSLFESIEHERDLVRRVDALFKSASLVSPKHHDDAYAEMLGRLLTIAEEEPLLALGALHICDELGWRDLEPHIEPLADMSWEGAAMARRILGR